MRIDAHAAAERDAGTDRDIGPDVAAVANARPGTYDRAGVDFGRRSWLALHVWRAHAEKLRFAIRNDAREFSVGANLSVHLCFTAHALNARAGAQGSHFEHPCIARTNRPADTCYFDSG